MATKAEISTLQQQVADSSHILDHQGLVDFHGHVSARIPGTNSILIKPVLRAHNQIKASDIITVDMDEYMSANTSQWNPDQQKGRVIDAPVPPRETMLHVCAYQHRSDVHSVVHTHQLVATAIGAGGQSHRHHAGDRGDRGHAQGAGSGVRRQLRGRLEPPRAPRLRVLPLAGAFAQRRLIPAGDRAAAGVLDCASTQPIAERLFPVASCRKGHVAATHGVERRVIDARWHRAVVAQRFRRCD